MTVPQSRLDLNVAMREAALLRQDVNGVVFEFVRIPAGEFMMGSERGKSNERPLHRVRITRDFLMQKTPVTQEQWEAVMGSNPSHFGGEPDSRRPVEQVSWEDAQTFIGKLNGVVSGGGFRLPTEAEWEYACRAGTTGDYAGTGRLEDMGWYGEDSGEETHPVERKRPNGWGLYDMHGNVWEWCQDWYVSEYYAQGPEADPRGPGRGEYRVMRGGSWLDFPDEARSAYRNCYVPSFRLYVTGFRLARTVSLYV